MANPLLQETLYPAFDQIKAEHIVPAIDTVLADNRAAISVLLHQQQPGWQDFVARMEALEDRLENVWSTISHLNSVMNSDEIRDAYKVCVQKVTEYSTELGQNKDLWQAYKQCRDSEEFKTLSQQQCKAIENILQDFHLSGVDLEEEKKQRFASLSQKLADLTSRFSDNVLDATQGWTLHVEDAETVPGLPESALKSAEQAAQQRDLSGLVFTLDIPSYLPMVTYCENADLRRQMYEAYNTRASECGPNAGKWDNTQIMQDILQVRAELAGLLGFANYAERSLARKMANTPAEVLDFLRELASKSKPYAEKDLQELREFAQQLDGTTELNAWDVPFYSEKLKQQRYQLSQEQLRPYFPLPRVLQGLFTCASRLFNIEIKNVAAPVPLWHEDVQFFEIHRNGEQIAAFYFDVYARSNKRGGAWMANCRTRRRLADGQIQLPVAFMVCNFSNPVDGRPALLTHDEVTTLFHEFGHGLHHMLTRMEVSEVSGINGVAWDAVELPSQFMENWCWEPEALELISGHFESGEPLPDTLLQQMLKARNFQAGLFTVRQLEFALFDFRLHSEYQVDAPVDILRLLAEVRDEVAVIVPPAFNRFPHSFSHIFAGGYAAGYYSYKWAEVLAADAFSLFEENGIFDTKTGELFRTTVLEQGGSREPMELFVEFRGRKPSVEPLLRHSGLAA
ncbi:MAG: oligopeptidase A [Pseudomonadales bacterium]|nr:oligopeptidase A [Pseudomonadales bacterium]